MSYALIEIGVSKCVCPVYVLFVYRNKFEKNRIYVGETVTEGKRGRLNRLLGVLGPIRNEPFNCILKRRECTDS